MNLNYGRLAQLLCSTINWCPKSRVIDIIELLLIENNDLDLVFINGRGLKTVIPEKVKHNLFNESIELDRISPE